MCSDRPTATPRGAAAPNGHVIAAGTAEVLGAPDAVRDRFLLRGRDTGGGFALLEHLLPPRTLAAPLHRHAREDEVSLVLAGRVGAIFDGDEIEAGPGDLVRKPRGEWHTFWNAGDAPARVLEIISPGGFERLFEEMHALGDELTPERLAAMAGRYGCEVDFERTAPLVARHGLRF